MDLALKDKYALVTGGSYGIGRGIALALAEEGCNVAICARNKERLEGTLQEIKAKGVNGLGISADATVAEDIARVMKTVADAWGTLHILVNNVGGGGGQSPAAFEEAPDDTWLKVYSANALAAVKFTMQAIPLMKKQRWGRVVTIASVQGREGGGRPWYNMAKSAEISLMKTLAMNHELSGCGITFNSVTPGAVICEGNEWDAFRRENPAEFQQRVDMKNPCGRLVTPQDVAAAVLFLCSEEAAMVNGASIPVDGAEGKSF